MAIFQPNDRAYSSWKFVSDDTNFEPDIDPVTEKLLVGDIIENNKIIRKSRYRSSENVAGVLVYDGNTYGRHSGRFLYKCVPNDRHLPIFLVPYSSKGKQTFDKSKTNKFVLFKFVSWENKHPLGLITNNLGDVSDLSVFYTYQLFCKDIHVPIQKLTKATKHALLRLKSKDNDSLEESSIYEDRSEIEVVTIDPEGSVDFDDAISIIERADGGHILSVYISNVPFWINKLNLWEHLTESVSTIYLPNSKRPMLPCVLSDDLCSLLEGEPRYVLAMDISLSSECKINSVEFTKCMIRVTKNYVYEEQQLLENSYYKLILHTAKLLCVDNQYIVNVNNSHDVVAYFMIMMNHQVGKVLMKSQLGIFRSVSKLNKQEITDIPIQIRSFMMMWRNTKSSYVSAFDDNGHELIGNGLDYYAQCTSPIRRIVDLINIMELQDVCCVSKKSEHESSFVDKWMGKLEYVNTSMKAIKKVQTDCLLLKHCTETCNKDKYKGFIIAKNDLQDTIRIPWLNLTTKLPSTGKKTLLYEAYDFTIHSFVDEATLMRKVRIQLV